MLLNSIDVQNSRGTLLSLPLEDISAGFVVRKIDGLGPVKATLVSSSFANMDGEQYHSSRREARNIVMSLGLKPDYAHMSVQDLRDQLYNFFMPKSSCMLTFHLFNKFAATIYDQNLDLDIEARVETCEPTIFTDDPALDISMMCFNPDFYDPATVQVDGMSVAGLTDSVLPYAGTTDTGVIFQLKPDRDVPDFTIYHRPPDQTLHTIDFTYPLIAGDILEISSVRGSKYAKVTRAGVESSVLYGISPPSDWLTLQPGDNNLRVYTDGAPIPYSITYTNKYGGL